MFLPQCSLKQNRRGGNLTSDLRCANIVCVCISRKSHTCLELSEVKDRINGRIKLPVKISRVICFVVAGRLNRDKLIRQIYDKFDCEITRALLDLLAYHDCFARQ